MLVQRLETISSEAADVNNFVGNATLKRMLLEPEVKVYRVSFEPEGRTNWHTHSGVQLLLVIEGTCWVQKRGEAKQLAKAGDVVMIAPEEDHWHGATDDEGAVHLAVNLGATTAWGDEVSDADYLSQIYVFERKA